MIKVMRKRRTKIESEASAYPYQTELVCDEVSELPKSDHFGSWIIDMGSTAHVINTGETYMLNSSGGWVPQKKTESEGLTFTEADKAKLDSLTNPILLKGRVNTFRKLPNEAETGWLYFVGEEDAGNFAEYIFTDDGEWEYIGDNSIVLSNYVQKTDYMTSTKAGIAIAGSGFQGITVSDNHTLRIFAATKETIAEEKQEYQPIPPARIPDMMSNYGITSKTLIGEITPKIMMITAKTNERGNITLKDMTSDDYTIISAIASETYDGSAIVLLPFVNSKGSWWLKVMSADDAKSVPQGFSVSASILYYDFSNTGKETQNAVFDITE